RFGHATAVDAIERMLDEREEGLGVERLGDRVDGSRLEHELVADLVRFGAHENDGERLAHVGLWELAAELEPVHLRHHEVDEHEVEGVADLLQRLERDLRLGYWHGFVAM